MRTGLPMVVNLVVQRLLAMTPINRILASVTVQVLLAGYRLKRILRRGDKIAPITHRQRVLRAVSVQRAPLIRSATDLLQLWNIGGSVS